jgi:hypothetical protein
VLGSLRDYHWGIGNVWGVLLGAEVPEELAYRFDSSAVEGYTPGEALFPEAARYVMNDWCDFHAVRKPRVRIEDFIKQVGRGWAGVAGVCDLSFYCVDGARWLMFARDPGLLDVMRGHHRAVLKPRGIFLTEKVDDRLE